jgi:uncharacterized membrane protein YqhA
MLKLVLSLRFIALFTSAGAVVGALLMFWVGAAQLIGAVRMISLDRESAKPVTAAVMSATDAFLFGAVLILFAYAIAFVFVLQGSPEYRQRLPGWMQVESIGELKRALIEVILVYLVVDFATDLAAGEGHVSWETLVVPISIVLIAGALRLIVGCQHKTAAG